MTMAGKTRRFQIHNEYREQWLKDIGDKMTWKSMGTCIQCGAPIFTSDEPVEGQPCLDCIFDGTADATDKEQARAASQFLSEAEIIIPPAPDETEH